jgi:Skp family chaperone for outer membrane proteins
LSKSNPSKNAITHGLYATEVVLPWEDPKEFSKLHEALRDEYWPDGFSEEAAISDMAIWYWKKRRLNVGSQLAFHRQQEASAIIAASSNGWQGVADYIASIQGDGTADSVRAAVKSQTEAAKVVYDTINAYVARIGKPDDATAESKEKESDAVVLDRLERLKALHRQMNVPSSDLVPLLRATEEFKLSQNVAEQAYRPDIMEKELKLHAEIDRRIEKAMKRLVQAKEYKRFYDAKSIISLPAKSPLRS